MGVALIYIKGENLRANGLRLSLLILFQGSILLLSLQNGVTSLQFQRRQPMCWFLGIIWHRQPTMFL